MTNPFVCPVCGYEGLSEPARSETGAGSYQICPSCWFEFGVTDDDEGWTDEQWRARWVSDGMPWRSTVDSEPADWDPRAQLAALLA